MFSLCITQLKNVQSEHCATTKQFEKMKLSDCDEVEQNYNAEHVSRSRRKQIRSMGCALGREWICGMGGWRGALCEGSQLDITVAVCQFEHM